MERVVSATEARVHFGELMRRAVENREPIIIERAGKSVVVVLSVEEYERLRRAQSPQDWRSLVDRARASIQADLGDRGLPASEEVLRQAREERDERLMAVR